MRKMIALAAAAVIGLAAFSASAQSYAPPVRPDGGASFDARGDSPARPDNLLFAQAPQPQDATAAKAKKSAKAKKKSDLKSKAAAKSKKSSAKKAAAKKSTKKTAGAKKTTP